MYRQPLLPHRLVLRLHFQNTTLYIYSRCCYAAPPCQAGQPAILRTFLDAFISIIDFRAARAFYMYAQPILHYQSMLGNFYDALMPGPVITGRQHYAASCSTAAHIELLTISYTLRFNARAAAIPA